MKLIPIFTSETGKDFELIPENEFEKSYLKMVANIKNGNSKQIFLMGTHNGNISLYYREVESIKERKI